MKMRLVLGTMLAALAFGAATLGANPAAKPATPAGDWTMDATIIEACSCPMFCTCYFGAGHPAGHHDMATHAEEHFCRFNNVFRVNHGEYKGTKLDGAKFWVAGDLGAEFAKGGEWATIVFDKAMSKEQRDGVTQIVAHLYPMKWGSFTTGEGDVDWTAGATAATAMLDGGKGGEVKLARGAFGEKGSGTVIKGLQYWAADHNEGFVLMPNSVEAFHEGPKAFSYNGTNGFMITIHAQDHPAAGAKSGF